MTSESGAEAVWAWIYQPLQDLKARHLENPDVPWDEQRAHLLEQLGVGDPAEHPVTAALLYHLDSLPPEQLGELLGSDELDNLAYQTVQEHTPAEHPEHAVEAGGYDEAAWHEFLVGEGPRWDGAEESWDLFREWFLYEAGQRGLATPAGQFIDYVSGTDKVEAFAAYGITIHPAVDPELLAMDAEILATHPELANVPVETRLRWAAEVLHQ